MEQHYLFTDQFSTQTYLGWAREQKLPSLQWKFPFKTHLCRFDHVLSIFILWSPITSWKYGNDDFRFHIWFHDFPIIILKHIWLVVWNIFYVSIYWECHHPNWLSLHHFSEGYVNHQPDIHTSKCTCLVDVTTLGSFNPLDFPTLGRPKLGKLAPRDEKKEDASPGTSEKSPWNMVKRGDFSWCSCVIRKIGKFSLNHFQSMKSWGIRFQANPFEQDQKLVGGWWLRFYHTFIHWWIECEPAWIT